MANLNDAFRVEGLSIDDIVGVFQGNNDPSAGVGEDAPIGSLFLQTTGELWIKVGPTVFDWEPIFSGATIGVGLNNASTGILDGGQISINADPTLFDIAAGVGIIVDNHTDSLNPSAQLVSWGAFTAVAPTFLATDDITYIAIDSAGSIIQNNTIFNNTDHKNYIACGLLSHPTNTEIQAVRTSPDTAFDAAARLGDLARAIGTINVQGNIFSPNGANLNLNKSFGKTYRLGTNFNNNKKDPDVTENPAQVLCQFRYSSRNGTGGFNISAPTVNVDPTQWDDGSGVLQTVPNGRYTIQHIHFFGGPEEIRIEYGQSTYSTLAAAHDAIPDPDHEHNPSFEEEGSVRAYIILSSNATNLTDPSSVLFVEGAKISGGVGGASSGSITTLQQAYLNSITPEITTTTDLGAVTIIEGSGVGGNLFEGRDSASTLNFAVDTAGNITTNGTIDGRDVALDGTTQDNHIADTSIHFSTLEGISDVVITTPADNDMLAYDTASGNWINQTFSDVGLALQEEVDNIETASGGIFVQSTGALQAGQFDAAVFGILGPYGAFTNVAAPTDLLGALYDLDQAIGPVGTDEKVKITANDTTAGFLDTSLLVGDGLSKTVNNPAADETLTLAIQQATVIGSPSPANDQIMFVLPDAVRAKNLSVETVTYIFAEAVVSPLEWLQMGDATNALTGIVAPLNGTVIRATAHCADTGGNTKSIDLYINGVNTTTIGTISGVGEQTFANTTINTDFTAGDKLRLRAGAEAGNITDTVITLYVKWRA